jgi:arabinogalactan oligomer / maltooligosaccharide transport system permease protein
MQTSRSGNTVQSGRQGTLAGMASAALRGITGLWRAVSQFFIQFATDVIQGDIWVKLSLVICGAGYFARKQYVRGIIATVMEAILVVFFPTVLWPYLSRFSTLGTVKMAKTYNAATGKNEFNNYDNSFLILLFGIIALFVAVIALILWVKNIRAVRSVQQKAERGKHVNSFHDDIRDHLNKKFHVTILTLPCLGILLFTIVPLLIMIFIAFTNYDKAHLVPTNLFTWTGISNFTTLFTTSQTITFAYSFGKVLSWTMIWAFIATFSNYFLGIFMAMFINNKKTYYKKLWRTCLMVSIAVPQFVSLLLVRNFFANTGIVNTICASIGLTDFLKQVGILGQNYAYIPFLTDPTWAKVMIILINLWVGIPYLMVMATGILMNIPADLLESAKIDGANAWQSFRKITMPYILFVTGPYLIASIVGNINNFNVIYLLTNDFYVTKDQLLANSNAQEVDLLVTWLYRLTQSYYNYKMASVLGILIFLICALFTLFAFRRTIKGDKEERFQ